MNEINHFSEETDSSIYLLLIYTSLGRRANNRKAAQFSPNAQGGKAATGETDLHRTTSTGAVIASSSPRPRRRRLKSCAN